MAKFNIGMIHGRFQPFHLGHFQYLKKALQLSSKLIIGITNPDPCLTNKDKSDFHRHLPNANPFPYFVRLKMVQQSILYDKNIKLRFKDITVVPFPINIPEMWKYYVPVQGVIQIMNIIDPWDDEKKKLFAENGYLVHSLGLTRYEVDHNALSGTNIRNKINNNLSWENDVPTGTKLVLKNWLANATEKLF